MPARCIEEPHRIVIEGVPPVSYRNGRDSLVLALNAAASTFNRALSYAALKGLSGLAFRLIFHQDWHRFTPDALCGYDHTGHLLNALGVFGSVVPVDPADPASIDASRDRILSSLREGYPVVAMHLMDYEDWGVVAGITSDDRLLCQTPHNEPDALAEHNHWPSLLLRISGEDVEPDHTAQFINSLRIAASLFATKRYGDYYSGRAAYRFWITSLQDTGTFGQLEDRGEQTYEEWVQTLLREDKDNFARDTRYTSAYLERAHVNAWRLESLIDARKAAAAYLAFQSERYTGKASTRIARAANLYAEQAELLTSARSFVSWEWNLPSNPWTAEMRASQAQVLLSALEIETSAVNEIQIFLSKFT